VPPSGGGEVPAASSVDKAIVEPTTVSSAASEAGASWAQPSLQWSQSSPAGGVAADAARPSVLSVGVRLKGEFACAGPLHVEGTVEGAVHGPEVLIGPSGSISGDVDSSKLSLKGRFNGRAVCGEVVIGPQARATGDITCGSMTLARGAVLEGRVSIGVSADDA